MDEKRFTLRMNQELFDLVKESASKNKRSVAKEIEVLLEEALTLRRQNSENQAAK